MASTISNTFSALITAYPTWEAMKTFLTSAEGGNITVFELQGTDLAMLRYVKDHSHMDVPHVKAFRSVVWNMRTNRPVSVTAFKSETGEGLPGFGPTSNILIEEFVDGVLIGQFWDDSTQRWRIHTRSMLNAECHYYSTRSFTDLFQEAVASCYGTDAPLTDRLEKGVAYSWILQHAENRIVCPVQKPRVVLVGAYRIGSEGGLEVAPVPEGVQTPRQYFTKGADATVGRMAMEPVLEVIGMVNRADYDPQGAQHGNETPAAYSFVPVDIPAVISMIASMRGSVRYQGVVIKTSAQPFSRWKIRTQVYNQVRKMRGNTARRDFLWIDLWSKGSLENYLKFYPEERTLAGGLVTRWKSVTQSVFKLYVDAFKARTLDRSQIPPKFRPLVYGLHNLYMTVLKPARKTLDWSQCVSWMNERDTAQKIFVLNWDMRQDRSAKVLPLEPPATSALRVNDVTAEAAATAMAAMAAMAAMTATADKEEGEI